MDQTVQVSLESVTKTYDQVIGVESLDLRVNKGEFFSLLGPSGCGKSTTLRLIAGFEQPDRGTVTIAGQPMQGVPPYKRNIGIVFQSYALFPHLDVFENVAFGLRTRRIAKNEIRTRVAQAIETVELTGLEKRKPHQLSGGQQQRVALARALAIEPRVLLLDEPLSALDANLREAMQVELKHLHSKLGLTFVMVTHDQTEALVMSDRIVVMHRGRIAQAGTPSDLYDRPETTYVADFVGTSNLIPCEVASVT
ncbi:MAG: ABC transporter ATP-binding protein, partial [Thermomicrobiales bacterium]|nr:ABC transporter ATP-binding protein [Thermomicrobiales bacterium]